MKPPPFTYHAPETVTEALSTLADLGASAKVLAGGQSLIPLLNMRLAAPEHLVDINGIEALDQIRAGDDVVKVGAAVRHAALEHHEAAARACPLLRQALRLVAHPVIRNRGTVCGSIAHADPAGELTAVLAVLGGTVELRRAGREPRTASADTFFVAPLESSIEPGELVTAVSFPALPRRAGSAFVEIARRHGDYALCGIAAVVELAEDGTVARARTGAISIHPTPLVVDHTESMAGAEPADADWRAPAEQVVAASEPEADLHASAAYRRELTRVLTARALRKAAGHARHRSATSERVGANMPRTAHPARKEGNGG